MYVLNKCWLLAAVAAAAAATAKYYTELLCLGYKRVLQIYQLVSLEKLFNLTEFNDVIS